MRLRGIPVCCLPTRGHPCVSRWFSVFALQELVREAVNVKEQSIDEAIDEVAV